MQVTIHFSEERKTRAAILEELKAPILSVNGKLYIFVVDKGHKNGEEIHVITENGVINIYNRHTQKYITGLIARPAQLERYGAYIPQAVLDKAQEHMNKGYNLIWWRNKKWKNIVTKLQNMVIKFFVMGFVFYGPSPTIEKGKDITTQTK